MTYNVFTDFHHAGLLNSLIMLFEGRLGGKVYRPIGLDWADKGFWSIYDHPATRQQFLGIGGATPDGTEPLNEVVRESTSSSLDDRTRTHIYHCKDIDSDFTNKAITFEGFMAMPFDIVIASIPQHIEPFKRLCELHPNKPKLIFQIGNAWTVEAGLAPNIMASAIINDVPDNINFISYHQEFDLNVFCPTTGIPENIISSFVNVFQDFPDWQLFLEIEKLMPDWTFKAYGGQCRDGAAHGANQVAEFMQSSKFIWHTKAGGDGYGHIIHNTGAVGRPMITKKSYYQGKMAEPLMIDGGTCIDIDNLSIPEILSKIEYYSESTRYAKMCRDTYQNFKKVVNFDKEEKEIKIFLSKLL